MYDQKDICWLIFQLFNQPIFIIDKSKGIKIFVKIKILKIKIAV